MTSLPDNIRKLYEPDEVAWNAAFNEMLAAAGEIAANDPDFLDESAGFLRVLWHDNDDMYRHRFGDDDWQSLLLKVRYRLLIERERGAK